MTLIQAGNRARVGQPHGARPLVAISVGMPLARRDISLQRGASVALGAKRTSTGGQDRLAQSRMPEAAIDRRARLAKSNGDFFERNARNSGGPPFAWVDRHRESQRARRNDLARAQWRVVCIICQQFDQMAERP
jgi:hypothetical protein